MTGYHFNPPRESASPALLGNQRRRLRDVVATAVAVLVAGSGFLNLKSVTGGPVPIEQAAWLRSVFPLDFAGLARSATLLIGFSLVLTAVHLWGHKRRAWHLSLVLAIMSAAFHLTGAWNVPEAACSMLIAAGLWIVREEFQMGSAKPDLLAAGRRAAGALLLAALYGVGGFWVLEPREFHHNFQWWDAAARTIRLMLFIGDPSLVPHTPYAVWFLDSLFWISAAAFLYCAVVLFRPVAYRFRPNPAGRKHAKQIAEVHGRSGQDYFKHGLDKSYFFSRTGRSFLAYRVANHFALVLGDPVGPDEELRTIVEDFLRHCCRLGWRAGFHQVAEDRLGLYQSLGFRYMKIGDDAIVDLTKFTLAGSKPKELRNTLNRLDRKGYRVERFEPPFAPALLDALKEISDEWLTIAGHRERQFTLGRFDVSYVNATPVYAAFDAESHPVAFLNMIPSYQQGLATVDLMRRSPGAASGIMDYLFAKVFVDLQSRGLERFSLGMAPLTCDARTRTTGERVMLWLIRRMPFVFRSESLRQFKAKFADYWVPRYTVYGGRLDLPRLGFALRRVSELRSGMRGAA
jgi:phosphatidylglycerol lysyltransferase